MLKTPNSATKFHQYTNSNKQRLLNNLSQISYMLKPYIYQAFFLDKKLTKLGDKINSLLKSLFTPKQDAKCQIFPTTEGKWNDLFCIIILYMRMQVSIYFQ